MNKQGLIHMGWGGPNGLGLGEGELNHRCRLMGFTGNLRKLPGTQPRASAARGRKLWSWKIGRFGQNDALDMRENEAVML